MKRIQGCVYTTLLKSTEHTDSILSSVQSFQSFCIIYCECIWLQVDKHKASFLDLYGSGHFHTQSDRQGACAEEHGTVHVREEEESSDVEQGVQALLALVFAHQMFNTHIHSDQEASWVDSD